MTDLLLLYILLLQIISPHFLVHLFKQHRLVLTRALSVEPTHHLQDSLYVPQTHKATLVLGTDTDNYYYINKGSSSPTLIVEPTHHLQDSLYVPQAHKATLVLGTDMLLLRYTGSGSPNLMVSPPHHLQNPGRVPLAGSIQLILSIRTNEQDVPVDRIVWYVRKWLF